MNNHARPAEILLVEDSPSDAGLTRAAFEEGKIDNNLHHVTDGVAALAFLRRQGEHAAAPRPDLVLLDLNLPKKGGMEVLRELRADPQLRHLVVVVLTTSRDENDVLDAYGLNVNAYITKPVDVEQFFRTIACLDKFFLRVVTLPPNG
jgi:two-component system, chemotaxis family, response regulator Rcp1